MADEELSDEEVDFGDDNDFGGAFMSDDENNPGFDEEDVAFSDDGKYSLGCTSDDSFINPFSEGTDFRLPKQPSIDKKFCLLKSIPSLEE